MEPQLRVLLVVPAGTEARLDAATAHLVRRAHDLGEGAWVRKVIGETSTPRRIRSVSRARPATTVQASVVGRPASPGKLV